MKAMAMAKLKKSVSLLVVLTFILSLVRLPLSETKTANAAEVKVNHYAVLVGDFPAANNLGGDWNPSNMTLLMSQISPDVYVKTVEFTTAGSYQYKAAMDGGWDVSYGDGSNNKLLKVESPGKIQFVLNTKEGKLYDSLNDSTYFKNTATVVGNLDANSNGGPSWNPADSSMDLSKLENGYFKGSLPMKKGNYEYKIAFDHKWSNGEVGSNVKLAVDTESDVTFFSNFYANLCTDSKSDSSILVVPSLIGTVRQGDDWTADKKGFEFNYYGNHKYMFGKYITKGSYEYKVIMDYKWGNGELPANNKTINVANDNGEYVVFVYDASRNAVFDSINDGNEIAKLFGMLVEVSSPKINADGTITFNYNDVSATSVSLRGSLNGWGETPLIKGADGNWSVKLRACDNAANIEYKFFVNGSNWVTDPLNPNTKDGNSVLVFPQYNGRTVVIAGTIQAVVGEGNWTPSSAKTTMNYVGNGTYKFEMNHVPAGNYEYKVAMGSWEPENYGAGGVPHGPNIQLTVPVEQSITFLYNDDSHRIVDSVSYKMLDAYLSGGPLTAEVKLEDKDFTGLYRTALELEKGVYSNFNVLIKGTDAKIIAVPEFEVDTKKLVTISYDPVTGFVFNDASSKKIEATKIIYNSRDIKFKKPYGAVKQNEKTSFTIETGRDVGAAKLVLLTPEGTKIVDMNITKGVESNTFSTEANFATIGTYSYYFVLTNGSDVVAYGDDVKADLGTGTAGALGSVKNYTVNVYKSDFKTPDWMKNAVVYQIYPDRFFNGDTGNDYLQKYARGYDTYEFYSNWYSIPENPREEQKDLNSYISKGGTVGDGIWSNEMYGGDVAGIKAKLDYLQALGVNVLYLNPVSASISNHRYDTTNYKELDPLLGRMSEYKELADEVNRRGMHLIIDGVYNHVSDDSVYFDRYGKYITAGKPLGAYQYWSHVYGLINSNGITLSDAEAQTAAYFAGLGITALQYKDWFKIDNVWVSKDGSGKDIPVAQQHYQYEGWWGYDSMPVIQSLNGSELNVASWKDEIVKGNTELWLGQGTAGYRLDVANEVSDETWRYFRDVVKAAGDNVIIGEIWTDASRYIMGDMYDSVMNYRFREAILDYLRDGVSGNDVNNTLEVIREQYPREAFEAMMNLVDSHDTERILSDMDGMVKDSTDEKLAEAPSEKAKRLQRLIPILQMTYPGAPTIYYGDELGMVGAKDPDNRRTMIWGKGDSQTLMAYASSANIRNSYAVLRTGEVAPIESNNSDLLIYERFDNSNEALVVVNKSENQVSLQVPVNHIPDGTVLKDALTGTAYTVNSGKVSVSLSGISGVILVTGYKVLKLDSAKLADGYAADAIVKDKVVPETVKTVIDRVLLPENNGKEVIVSSMSEEIVKAIFDAAVQNNVKPVIVRGDTSFVITNPKAISEAITSAGTTGLILTRNQETALNYKDLAEKLKASKYEMFNFETNINTKIKQDIAVKINITAKKPKLYVYTDKIDGTFEQIIDTAYTGNMLQFKLASFGSIIVSEVPIPQLLNVNYKKK